MTPTTTTNKPLSKPVAPRGPRNPRNTRGPQRGGRRGRGPKTMHSAPLPGKPSKGVAAATPVAGKDTLRIIPLGGVEEVGRNLTVFEYGNDILIVDMGFGFPGKMLPGLNYTIPNYKWLEENKHRIRGIVITHGHMDHIGAIPYILPRIGFPPIYSLPLSIGFIKYKLQEFNLTGQLNLNPVSPDDVIALGGFRIRFFRVNHNIPDSMGVSIITPLGQIIHTGDWKLDHTPVDERPAELNKLAQFGGQGVLALLSDSTNAEKAGYCSSEQTLGETIDRTFRDAPGRIIFTSNALIISRIQQVFDAAQRYGRRVLVVGRSMLNNIEVATSLGYLKINQNLIISSAQRGRLPDNKIIVLTTGAQGEELAGLARMARGEHREVTLKMGDTAVVSANPIPGNERAVADMVAQLTKLGVIVLHHESLDIHISGHARQDELKLMMRLTKPKYFMPVHGERHMLVAHGRVAQSLGIPEENVFIMRNGNIVEFTSADSGKVIEETIEAQPVYVDEIGVGYVSPELLQDKEQMRTNGMVAIVLALDKKTGKSIGQPQIISRGFIYNKTNDDLLRKLKHETQKLIESRKNLSAADLEKLLKDEVGEYVYQKTGRQPLIMPVIEQR